MSAGCYMEGVAGEKKLHIRPYGHMASLNVVKGDLLLYIK